MDAADSVHNCNLLKRVLIEHIPVYSDVEEGGTLSRCTYNKGTSVLLLKIKVGSGLKNSSGKI